MNNYNKKHRLKIFNENIYNIKLNKNNIDYPIFSKMIYNFTSKNNFCDIVNNLCLSGVTHQDICLQLSGDTFDGGFYQGQYEQSGLTLTDGFTIEAIIKEDGSKISCQSGIKLNESFPKNEGYFFYMGVKKENPFCGYELTGDVIYNEDIKIDENQPFDTNFLNWTTDRLGCEFTGNTKTIESVDCCEGIYGNNFGIKLENGIFSIKRITLNTDCYTGETISLDRPKHIIEEYKSDRVIFDNNWKHIVIRWKPYVQDECKVDKLGILELYINGKLKWYIENFKQFSPYETKYGQSYNISIGGGTLGYLDGKYDVIDEDKGGKYCKYSACLNASVILKSITVNGFEYDWGHPISESKEFLKVLFGNDLNFEPTALLKDRSVNYQISFISNKEIEVIKSNFEDSYFMKSDCLNKEISTPCELLTNNFAGTFIGNIDCVNIYDKSLTIQQICELYMNSKYFEKEKYCCD